MVTSRQEVASPAATIAKEERVGWKGLVGSLSGYRSRESRIFVAVIDKTTLDAAAASVL